MTYPSLPESVGTLLSPQEDKASPITHHPSFFHGRSHKHVRVEPKPPQACSQHTVPLQSLQWPNKVMSLGLNLGKTEYPFYVADSQNRRFKSLSPSASAHGPNTLHEHLTGPKPALHPLPFQVHRGLKDLAEEVSGELLTLRKLHFSHTPQFPPHYSSELQCPLLKEKFSQDTKPQKVCVLLYLNLQTL